MAPASRLIGGKHADDGTAPTPLPRRPRPTAGHTVLPPTEASQAEKTGRMRYIFGISLSLAVVAMAAIHRAF